MTAWAILALSAGAGVAAALVAVASPGPLAAFLSVTLAAAAALGAVGALLGARREAVLRAMPPEPQAAGEPDEASPARALIATVPSALVVIGRTGRVAYANPAALRLLPRLKAGAHYVSLIRAPAFVEAVAATFADGGERSLEFETREGSAERRFGARVGLMPADAAFGPEPHALALLDDRTEARRIEDLRSDFIANASHELRTPLASIVGYIETLQHHAREDPAARERFLGIMAREAARMQRLVDDLMSLSRIEMSEHLPPSEEWSLNAIAAESAAAIAPLAEQEGVTLTIDLAADLAPGNSVVRGDRDQLAQVFANLIDNAVKYSGRGATVRVFAAPPNRGKPGRHGVVVADDGPGIPREHLPRLTERFYRVSAASSRTKGGTGLGLAIVKHILNRHGGRLEIASGVGKGATFTVWLPRAGADEEAEQRAGEVGAA